MKLVLIRLLAVFSSIGMALGYGFAQGLNQASPNKCSHNVQTQPPPFSQVEYERLKLSMPLAEVEAILGRGGEVSRSTTRAIFRWKSSCNYSITATFENNKLTSKEQSE